MFYVGKVLELQSDGHTIINFLRLKSNSYRDTFYFPDIEDIQKVVRSRILGVLQPMRAMTQRLSSLLKIFPPLGVEYDLR